mmetsp:Transcript_10060/g.14756  ORF Transcript_10060/g.14756 Transcript_10060/m.14756 type:complete len:247 (+) Transcript_10060:47-787(+)|eukprot:CAMPEP_0197241274 /NCGR_PEP_ID=MMETSP1429-20130617/7357_1 /TAXON_ID=49237 /ORGANISM="Chaetoceros  sp., Strain UNC1202" /LENGTH=246 /DNA_ID=CAMNT_0042701085 /DNA_START=34 /DNA_END=774 /DNA_ORIENTATION=+
MHRPFFSSLVILLSVRNGQSFAPIFSTHAVSGSGVLKDTPVPLTQLHAIDPSSITSTLPIIAQTSSILTSNAAAEILSNENIKLAFNAATFGPQILWLLMILVPNATITKKIMGSYTPIIAFSLVHLFIVIASATQENGTAPIAEFNDVFAFDPTGNGSQSAMVNMMRYPNFVSEEWSHVLTWDLFVGRIVWLDGLKRGIFTPHSVLFCNLIGPPGFLMHCATCLLTGKGIIGNGNEALEEDESNE